MSEKLSKQQKKEIMKDIILQLHQGLSTEEAKKRFEKEIGDVTSTEIAEIEQSLINEGLSPDEIKKFCNVHALLFKAALEKSITEETSSAHPIHLFKLENREIEKLTASLKELVGKKGDYDLLGLKEKLNQLLKDLKEAEKHYERKEQLLFPFLEKQGFFGPTQVMWGKDNEIRELLRKALAEIEKVKLKEEFQSFKKNSLLPLIEEVEGMIFKEENILFPTSLEKLPAGDWVEILKESDEVGYVYIDKPKETDALIKELEQAFQQEPAVEDNEISLPTGKLNLKELMAVFNTLPVDITFVDKEDRVKYFSDNKQRIFTRTKSVIGRKVQNCHPPQSVEAVKKILESFKKGEKDHFDFWINLGKRYVYIRYFAVRDKQNRYLGTLEVTQDITDIKKLEGEKRLLD